MFTNKNIAGNNLVTKSSILDDIENVLSINSIIKDIPENNTCKTLNNDVEISSDSVSISSIDNASTSNELVELTDEDLEYLSRDDNSKIFDIQKELLRNKKYIDNQINNIDILTRTYDKFSKSVYETKLEMVKERSRILESLSKIVNEQIKRNSELDDAKDITEIFGK